MIIGSVGTLPGLCLPVDERGAKPDLFERPAIVLAVLPAKPKPKTKAGETGDVRELRTLEEPVAGLVHLQASYNLEKNSKTIIISPTGCYDNNNYM